MVSCKEKILNTLPLEYNSDQRNLLSLLLQHWWQHNLKPFFVNSYLLFTNSYIQFLGNRKFNPPPFAGICGRKPHTLNALKQIKPQWAKSFRTEVRFSPPFNHVVMMVDNCDNCCSLFVVCNILQQQMCPQREREREGERNRSNQNNIQLLCVAM